MKPRPNKLTHRQKEESEAEYQQIQQTQGEQVFESVEALVQHDMLRTKVPASIEARLVESLSREKSPWWRKWIPKAR